MNLRGLHVAAFAAVVASWIAFPAIFMLRKRSPGDETRKAERVSIIGVAIQGAAYALVWMLQRRWFTPILPLPGLLQAIPALLAAGLSGFSLWLAMTSVRVLGREWSLEARVVEGHRLVTEGPYGVVCHPIYTAMLGMLVATGLVVSHWIGLLAALTVFGIGTAIRVRSEERLLREQFGDEFEAYARRVPAILPRWAGP